MRLVAVLGAAVLYLLVAGVAAPSSARAYFGPVSTGCPAGMAVPCYVWHSPEGVVVEGVEPISQVHFESLTDEVVATIDEVAGRPTAGLGAGEVEAGGTAAEALASEGDVAVLAGAEDAASAVGVVGSFSAVGTFALGASALAVGWEIGSAIDGLLGIGGWPLGGLFGDDGANGPPYYLQARYVRALSKGQFLTQAALSHAAAPVDGFEVLFIEDGHGDRIGASNPVVLSPVSAALEENVVEGVPEGFQFIQVKTFHCVNHDADCTEGVYFRPAPVQELRPHEAGGFPGQDLSVFTSAGAELPVDEQQASVAAGVLENGYDDAFTKWLLAHDGVAGHSELLTPFVTVPECGGLTYAQCAAKLEAEGLEPVRNTLGWQQADIALGPESVTGLEPSSLSRVEEGSSVTVTANPGASGMPVVVPQWSAHETYVQYVAGLSPALSPHRLTVTAANEEVSAGPDAVLSTAPAPGSRVDPSSTTELQVRTNPSDAPAAGGGSGPGSCSASVGAIDWGPLNQPLGDKFPFGVFGFFAGWLSSWESGQGQAPDWTFTVLPAGAFGSPGGLHVHVDLAFFGPVVSVVRVVFLFAAFVGLLWFLATAAAKLQGDAS